MIQILYKENKATPILELEESAENTWVHVERPTETELQMLTEEFSLEYDLLHDALDHEEVPRVEEENGVMYIFTRYATILNEEIQTAPMLIIVAPKHLITISNESFPRIRLFKSGKIEFSTLKRNQLVTKLFGQINDSYNDYLNNISKRIRTLSVRFERITNKDIIQFVTYENILYDFNSALVRIHAICNNLLGGKFIKLVNGDRDKIEDIALDTMQHIQIAKENLQSMVNIREGYSTIMTNKLNQIIKLFTSLTVVLTIPTIVGSFYGMNVPLPFQESPIAFTGIIVLTMIICSLVLVLFFRKEWM